MQERHDRDLTELVMLGRAWQTAWVMENMHDKPISLPDPDIFAFDKSAVAGRARRWKRRRKRSQRHQQLSNL